MFGSPIAEVLDLGPHRTLKIATVLFAELYARGFDGWECPEEVIRVAGLSGLGVLTKEASDYAVERIRSDYRKGKRLDRELYARVGLRPEFALRWANRLLEGATRYPSRVVYPIQAPSRHVVGVRPCLGKARNRRWTDACLRAAWGNVFPCGLTEAEKPCPGCRRLMAFWQVGRGEELGWGVGRVRSHEDGGCRCHFNLEASCHGCYRAKGASSW